jgi:hypothetical protein
MTAHLPLPTILLAQAGPAAIKMAKNHDRVFHMNSGAFPLNAMHGGAAAEALAG